MEIKVIRTLSATMFLGIVAYTLTTVALFGVDLVTPFFTDLVSLSWPGQFNFDFSLYLILSTLWYVWRNGFTQHSLMTAPVILIGGMCALSAYWFWLSYRVQGRIDVLLMGQTRATQ